MKKNITLDMPNTGRRRLAAIMFTDIVGYTHVMQDDETRGRMLRERHKTVFEHCTSRFDGRIVQYFGDGTLSVFDSAVSAVECAVCMQKNLKSYPQVPLRIGIHLGDIHYDETEVYGHGVNVAARIEPVCNPGGVFISSKVNDEIKNHPWLNAKSIGVFRFKNIDQELELFAVQSKDVSFPNEQDISKVQAKSQRVSFSDSGEQSHAIQRFIREKKLARRNRVSKWMAIGLFVLLSVIALAKFNVFSTPIPDDDGRISIAVLPFANMSPIENDYFSAGMTEDILTKLSKIQSFSVTSRTSVMQYKDTDKSTREIARELGVNNILEGSVRREGDMVRITAQLIDARNDSHIWSESYDEEFKNIFSVQKQVAADIAHHLKRELSDDDLKVIEDFQDYNVNAYDLYLKGREHYRMYTEEDNDKAIAYFKDALIIEPEYAYAFAGLGDAYAQKAFRQDMNEQLLDTAVLMSARAVKADPKLSEGYKALGLAFHYQGKMDEAIVQYEKALELDPYNDMASNNLGVIEKSRGNFSEAARWGKRTLEINKNVPSSVANMASIYMEIGDDISAEQLVDAGISMNADLPELQAIKSEIGVRTGNWEKAQKAAEKVIVLEPNDDRGYGLLGNVYLYDEKWGKAAKNFDFALENSSKETTKLKFRVLKSYAMSKQTGTPVANEYWSEMLVEMDSLKDEMGYGDPLALVFRAAMESEIGNTEEAIEALQSALEANWVDYKTMSLHPIFEKMRDTPEFLLILEEMHAKSDSLRKAVEFATTDNGT